MKFLKENKIVIIGVTISAILGMFLEDTKLGKYVDIAFSVLIALFFLIAIIAIFYLGRKNMSFKQTSKNKLLQLADENKKQFSGSMIKLTAVTIILLGILCISIEETLIPAKYGDIVFTISLISLIITIGIIIILGVKQSTLFDISKNPKEKDKLVKEYEEHILNLAEEYIKENNKNKKTKVKLELLYHIGDKLQEKRPKLTSDYTSSLNIFIYQGEDLIDSDSYNLIKATKSSVLKKVYFEVLKTNEQELYALLEDATMIAFSEDYAYYSELKDLKKNIKCNKMDNIKYFMLIPEEKNDSPYYNNYFTYIEEDYSEFKDLLEDLGIDYKKPYKVSCEREDMRVEVFVDERKKQIVETLTYNAVYKGEFEIEKHLLESKIGENFHIGVIYNNEIDSMVIFINFTREEIQK